MQAPIKEIREQYLNENDIQILIENIGQNEKEKLGYNKNFSADYSGVTRTYKFDYDSFDSERFYNQIFPRVLVIARFQGMHRGHKIVLEEAKRLSPNITIGLRNDEGDALNLDGNIDFLKNMGYHVIKTPDLNESKFTWEKFVQEYDIVVQGNPDVITKFQEAIDHHKVQLHYVPRVGHISATKIRQAIKEGRDEFALRYITTEVYQFLKEELR